MANEGAILKELQLRAPAVPAICWAAPTHHKCEGMCAMRVEEGNFGAVKLGGLIWAASYHWPGPLHEGNGTLQPYVSDNATPDQRMAVLTILSGKAGNPWFEVLASVVSTVLEPKFVPIAFQFDLEGRKAKVAIPNELETITEPIRNAATGDEFRVRIDLPKGMEYFKPEIAQRPSRFAGRRKIRFDCTGVSHSSLANVEHTHRGLVA